MIMKIRENGIFREGGLTVVSCQTSCTVNECDVLHKSSKAVRDSLCGINTGIPQGHGATGKLSQNRLYKKPTSTDM